MNHDEWFYGYPPLENTKFNEQRLKYPNSPRRCPWNDADFPRNSDCGRSFNQKHFYELLQLVSNGIAIGFRWHYPINPTQNGGTFCGISTKTKQWNFLWKNNHAVYEELWQM